MMMMIIQSGNSDTLDYWRLPGGIVERPSAANQSDNNPRVSSDANRSDSQVVENGVGHSSALGHNVAGAHGGVKFGLAIFAAIFYLRRIRCGAFWNVGVLELCAMRRNGRACALSVVWNGNADALSRGDRR